MVFHHRQFSVNSSEGQGHDVTPLTVLCKQFEGQGHDATSQSVLCQQLCRGDELVVTKDLSRAAPVSTSIYPCV